MGVEIPTGFGQVTAFFSGMNLPRGAACTLGFSNDIPATAPAIATSLNPLYATLVQALSTPDVTLTEIRVKLGPTSTGPFAFSSVNQIGSQGTTTMTSQVALNIRKVTAFGGRINRGRMFWPGVPEVAFNDAGVIESGSQTQFDTALETFYDDMVALSLPPYLLHSDLADAPTEIESLEVGTRSITQRPRNR